MTEEQLLAENAKRSRRPAFRQIEITRAVRGLKAAGLDVSRIVINRDCTFEIVPGERSALDTTFVNGADEEVNIEL